VGTPPVKLVAVIQQGLIRVIDGGKNFEHLHLLIIHDICKEFGYILTDKDGNEYDFTRTTNYIDSCIAKKQTNWDKIPEWRKVALEAARDFVTEPDFNDIDKDIDEGVILTVKQLNIYFLLNLNLIE